MKIGVPREIKVHEYRVGVTPAGVHELTRKGHHVCIQHNAGERIGFSNSDYRSAGAAIENNVEKIVRTLSEVLKCK